MKIYEKNTLEKKEGILLRRLYLTQYHSNILFKKSASIETFISELKNTHISANYIRKLLTQLLEINGIQFHRHENDTKYYFINKDIILKLLEKDETFKLDKNIYEKTYYILEK